VSYLCILHSADPNKDKAAFAAALDVDVKNTGKSSAILVTFDLRPAEKVSRRSFGDSPTLWCRLLVCKSFSETAPQELQPVNKWEP
jgi:hypothetical protein